MEKGGGLSRKIHTGCVDKYIILGVMVAKSTLFVVARVGRESPPFLETQICFVFRYFFKESRALAMSDDDHDMATKPHRAHHPSPSLTSIQAPHHTTVDRSQPTTQPTTAVRPAQHSPPEHTTARRFELPGIFLHLSFV